MTVTFIEVCGGLVRRGFLNNVVWVSNPRNFLLMNKIECSLFC